MLIISMSSINPNFTFHYEQPEEYRFCHDSVFLARRVFDILPQNKKVRKALDLCSGVGIIGLDFLFHHREAQRVLPEKFDFLEVQSIYKKFFDMNVEKLGEMSAELNFLNLNYKGLLVEEYKEEYDLILCNPPYFRLGQGLLSPSEFKNRCRFFIDSDFKTLLEAIHFSLRPEGVAYMLLRDLKENGVDTLKEAEKILEGKRNIKKIEEIRGTPLVSIQ